MLRNRHIGCTLFLQLFFCIYAFFCQFFWNIRSFTVYPLRVGAFFCINCEVDGAKKKTCGVYIKYRGFQAFLYLFMSFCSKMNLKKSKIFQKNGDLFSEIFQERYIPTSNCQFWKWCLYKNPLFFQVVLIGGGVYTIRLIGPLFCT